MAEERHPAPLPNEAINAKDKPFAQVLHAMISCCDGVCPDAARFGDNGEGIIIGNKAYLERHVLPMFFRHSRYRSLQRQLQKHGFEYRHINKTYSREDGLFHRSHPERAASIRPKAEEKGPNKRSRSMENDHQIEMETTQKGKGTLTAVNNISKEDERAARALLLMARSVRSEFLDEASLVTNRSTMAVPLPPVDQQADLGTASMSSLEIGLQNVFAALERLSGRIESIGERVERLEKDEGKIG